MTAPAMMLALVVVMMATAVTLDRLWLNAANAELTTAAESAALRAGRLLASDDLLRQRVDHEARLQRAREEAASIASTNRIAGKPVHVDDSKGTDIRFGHIRLSAQKRKPIFVETDYYPQSVVVRAAHTRSKNNPVALFMGGLTGRSETDVIATAEATIENLIVAFRPHDGVPVPAIPMAILKNDPAGRIPSWDWAIEKRLGSDQLGFDEETNQVYRGADGIPELRLRSPAFGGRPEDANVHFFGLHRGTSDKDIIRQITTGWTEYDLPKHYKGLLRLDLAHPDWRTHNVANEASEALNKLIGQCRIAFLYDQFQPVGEDQGTLGCVGVVAARIMALKHLRDGSCEFIIQPCVITTRTAITAKEMPIDGPAEMFRNRYIYKLQLTY